MKRLICAVSFLACFAAISTASFAQGARSAAARITQPINEASLVRLAGNTNPLARAQYDRGAVADSLPMEHMLLMLKRSPEQEQALQTFIGQLGDPNSANYHKWLTAVEFGERFGPSLQDIATVVGWLQSHGLQANVYPSGMAVDVSGTAGQVRHAFNTELHNYDVNGVKHVANASDPQIPAALAPVVVGFASLNDFMPQPTMHNLGAVRQDRKTGKWKPVGWAPTFSFSYQGYEYYDVGPQDFATIYNVTPLRPGLTGTGQTIAVIEDSNMNATDWSTFRKAFGLSAYSATLTQVQPQPPKGARNCSSPGVNADESEAALDAEWSSAVAPSAKIELASCKDTATTFGGLLAAHNLVNSAKPPKIISMSYGECESMLGSGGNAAYSNLWLQAMTEGISVYVAAGDSGASVCSDPNAPYTTTGINVNGLASTPYNVAVGGTDFNDLNNPGTYWSTSNTGSGGSAQSYIPEIPWNDSCASNVLAGYLGSSSGIDFCNNLLGELFYGDIIAGSGGPSNCATSTCAGYSKPTWQSVLGNPGDSVRDVPDVSLFAGNGLYSSALLFCMSNAKEGGVPCSYTNSTDALYNSAGGTSFAAPAFAGIQALINQKTGKSWGNPNSELYPLANTEYGSSESCNSDGSTLPASTCIFYDVTNGDNNVVCGAGSPDCYAPSGDSYGVLSPSPLAPTPPIAYPAGEGWDFATGLGTVNVANLVNAWP